LKLPKGLIVVVVVIVVVRVTATSRDLRSNLTAWYAEVLVARISQEIEFFWPAPGLNPYPSDRKSVTLSSPVLKCIFD